ncbi:MAG: S8 family serine peptidase [Acidobacteriota bacterium]
MFRRFPRCSGLRILGLAVILCVLGASALFPSSPAALSAPSKGFAGGTSAPNDPFVQEPIHPIPGDFHETYQWPLGYHYLFDVKDIGYQDAWDLSQGHGYIGILDGGFAAYHGNRGNHTPSIGMQEIAGQVFRPQVDGLVTALGNQGSGGRTLTLRRLDQILSAPPLATVTTSAGGPRWRFAPILPVTLTAGVDYVVLVESGPGSVVRQTHDPGFEFPRTFGDVTLMGGVRYAPGDTSVTVRPEEVSAATDIAFRPVGSNIDQRPWRENADRHLVTVHPDLEGSFREHLSPSWGWDARAVYFGQRFGHGIHVAGLAGADTDNGSGVAGVCGGCSLLLGNYGLDGYVQRFIELVDAGVQVINMSFGDTFDPVTLGPLRDAIEDIADRRDVVLVAAAGNDGQAFADFPAEHPDVLGIAGTDPLGHLWSDLGNCASPGDCASNFGVGVSLSAPAKNVLSTWYPGNDYDVAAGGNGEVLCGDSLHGAPADGYGLCTGTSMSAPQVTGAVGLLRSAHPLLPRGEVKTALESTARNTGSNLGAGLLDVGAALEMTLGASGGVQVRNRLTPLFSLYSAAAEDFFYTTVPQMAASAIQDSGRRGFADIEDPDYPSPAAPYASWSNHPTVAGYNAFPDGAGQVPRSNVHVFTTDWNPATGNRDLVPLYRLSYVAPTAQNAANRDTGYATWMAGNHGVEGFRALGYELDGVEGYIFPPGAAQPAGTVGLYRRYNSARKDSALLVEGESIQGYTVSPILLGYVYASGVGGGVDSDGDGLIDGFEALLGTDPAAADSDCDGASDGAEMSLTALPTDPLDGACGPDVGVDLTTGSAPGGNYSVAATVTDWGPGVAQQVVLEVLFESSHWDWYVTPPAGCAFVPPAKGIILIGTRSLYRCNLGNLAAGGSLVRSFTVQPSVDPSTLAVIATVTSSTHDPQPANDQDIAYLNGGSLVQWEAEIPGWVPTGSSYVSGSRAARGEASSTPLAASRVSGLQPPGNVLPDFSARASCANRG